MKVVIDANIIFSCLISGKIFYLEILNNLDVYAPDFILRELEKYEKLIINKVHQKYNFKIFLFEIFKKISIIPKIGISKKSYNLAYTYCNDIDEKDIPYVALAIELNSYLWTNDKKLKKGLLKKHFNKIITTEELILLLRGK